MNNNIHRYNNRSRTKRRMRKQYGEYPTLKPTKHIDLITIAVFVTIGIIILGTLYWLFG